MRYWFAERRYQLALKGARCTVALLLQWPSGTSDVAVENCVVNWMVHAGSNIEAPAVRSPRVGAATTPTCFAVNGRLWAKRVVWLFSLA